MFSSTSKILSEMLSEMVFDRSQWYNSLIMVLNENA